MRPVETILGMEGGKIKESDGGDELKYDILDTLLRTFVNATMYPHSAQE
jgi:hypothetical protein